MPLGFHSPFVSGKNLWEEVAQMPFTSPNQQASRQWTELKALFPNHTCPEFFLSSSATRLVIRI